MRPSCLFVMLSIYVAALPNSVDGAPPYRDVVFATPESHELRLDLFLPKDADNAPLVVFIHGGGWRNGSYKRCLTRLQGQATRDTAQPDPAVEGGRGRAGTKATGTKATGTKATGTKATGTKATGTSQSGSFDAPYPPSPVITGIQIDWSTHERLAVGSDNWQLTWADDDHQYGAWGDGGGFGGTNRVGRVGLGFGRIEGNWDDFTGFNVWGGKDAENPAQFAGKSWGTICVGGVLYSWVTPDAPDAGGQRDHYQYIQLAHSSDRAAHWSKPAWRWWLRDNLIIPTFLVYGKNNESARDEYVYSYFIRPASRDITQSVFDLKVHRPGAPFLARAPKDQLLVGRDAFQWYTGMRDGQPNWGPLAAKKAVFENADGTGWCVSASYNRGLNRYLLATEHDVSQASVMSLFDAPEPWGPWTTVKYWSREDMFGQTRPGSSLDWADNIFYFSFAPKWLSDDGRSFTLIFTGGGRGSNNDSFNSVRGTFHVAEPAKGSDNG